MRDERKGRIEVCGIPYTVSLVDGWKNVSHDPEEAPRYAGEVHWLSRDIRIDGSRDQAVVDQTLWHEIIHTVVETLKIRELIGDDGQHMEIPVEQLAVGISSVMKYLGVSITKEVTHA